MYRDGSLNEIWINQRAMQLTAQLPDQRDEALAVVAQMQSLMHYYISNRWLRLHVVQLAHQLPENEQDALAVLALMESLVQRYICDRPAREAEKAGESVGGGIVISFPTTRV